MLLIRIFLLLFVLTALAGLAVASENMGDPAPIGDYVIGDSVTGDLRWGENLSLDGYRLVAEDFSRESASPSVLLKLYQGSAPLMEQPLCQGENFTFNDTGMVNVDSIFMPDRSEGDEEPSASVRLALYAAPSIQLHLTSDKDSYDPGEEIRLKLIAENDGIVKAEGIQINLSSQPEFFHFHDGFTELEAGNSSEVGEGGEEKWIRLKAPLLPGPSQIRLKAAAIYSDSNWKDRESTGYCLLDVSGQISLHKSVTDEMVPGKEYPVILTLRNFGQGNVYVHLEDSISEGFDAESELSWKLELEPGKTETVSYNIKPKGPGVGFVLPSALATYDIGNESYESRSESLSVDVSGPFLEVEKKISSSAVNPGDDIVVSINVINRGNRTVKASLNEAVADWAKLMGGGTHLSQILNSGEEASLSYSLSCDKPGDYEIPETMVFYSDARGDQYSVNSSSLSLEVLEEKPNVNKTAAETTAGTTPAKRDNSTGQDISMNQGISVDQVSSTDLISSDSRNGSAGSDDFGNLNHLNNSASLLISSASVLVLIYFLLGRIL